MPCHWPTSWIYSPRHFPKWAKGCIAASLVPLRAFVLRFKFQLRVTDRRVGLELRRRLCEVEEVREYQVPVTTARI